MVNSNQPTLEIFKEVECNVCSYSKLQKHYLQRVADRNGSSKGVVVLLSLSFALEGLFHVYLTPGVMQLPVLGPGS